MPDELAGKHPPLATPPGAAQAAAPLGDDSGRRGPEHGLRAGAGAGGDDARATRPDRATRFVETTRGTLSHAQLAPLLAERVAAAETELYREAFAARAPDESFLLDLQARWPETTATLSDLTLGLLTFAEGRFLTIHPFSDFNGHTIRLFLRELLRRLDFPRVILEPDTDAGRAAYFAGPKAADRSGFQPLVDIWRDGLAHAETPEA